MMTSVNRLIVITTTMQIAMLSVRTKRVVIPNYRRMSDVHYAVKLMRQGAIFMRRVASTIGDLRQILQRMVIE